MEKKNEMHVLYETDDIEQARLVAANNKNVSVVYHNPNRKIPPVLTLKINGHSYTKWNPEYIEYLRKEHPGISDKEIRNCIESAIEQLELTEAEKKETYDSSVRKKIIAIKQEKCKNKNW